MTYIVKISLRAERDLAQLYDDNDAEHSETARKWYRALKKSILSLAEKPKRCPITPENKKLKHLWYGSRSHVYRTLFTVDRQTVNIVHIRHGHRKAL